MIVQLGLPLKPVEIPVIDTVDIVNPGFEEWENDTTPIGWGVNTTDGEVHKETGQPLNGNYNAAIYFNTTLYQDCMVTPDSDYMLRVYYFMWEMSSDLTIGVSRNLSGFDSDIASKRATSYFREWHDATVRFHVPAGVRKIRIWFRHSGGPEIQIDDVSCVRV